MFHDIPELEMERVLQSDAAEIFAAREKGRLIYGTHNISAAGDEVERAVRRVLWRKLPQTYHVGQGHIVDSTGVNSPQMDVIVADNSVSPVLFEAENGTQYFPYESVYSIGEIKTAYYKNKKPIESFTNTLKSIRSTLHREPVFSHEHSKLHADKDVERTYGSLNPLFSFMLFVEGGEFAPHDISELYSKTPAAELPNVVCFLDRGVIVFKSEGDWSGGEPWSYNSPHPGLESEKNLVLHSRQSGNWYFNSFGSERNRIGAQFGFLYSLVLSFLGRCTLNPPDMAAYMERILKVSSSERVATDQVPPFRIG
ncbi:MAG TPA: DUF6602 domain-containing protein [Pyrinomonadaceae bacterium]|jgi:hypothetical protein|nr:DUF6602 domain-containing protein [Pyrinomonadaceae bacterium]